ncbi:hypothetical protein QJS10_CPB14g00038 [Acorus calamus]|uniref:Uncharacterized protein n=1 Tax=Acorus calamus TaxID=4465 RepID=A0AAV9DDE4_ACOCL|nr:hypothetical protein QJS10_CPB14g00038 [Acorus calamus]
MAAVKRISVSVGAYKDVGQIGFLAFYVNVNLDVNTGYIGQAKCWKEYTSNKMIGQKLLIVTDKPQTTRHWIFGICSGPEYQVMLLYDAPGVIGKKMHKLDSMMMGNVRSVAMNADCVLVVADTSKLPHKKDLIKPGEIAKRIEDIAREHPHPERFFIAEIVREKVFMQYRNEVPYACQVKVNVVNYISRPTSKDYIVVEIVVEKNSQKIIFIGKEGKEIKILATAARFELKLEVAFYVNVNLDLYTEYVGQAKCWTEYTSNKMIGQKLSIVNDKPQMTRHWILGICSGPEYQVILYDAPGVIGKKCRLCTGRVRSAAINADCVLVVADASKLPHKIDEVLEEGVGISKKDLIKPGEIAKRIEDIAREHPHPERFFIAEIIREKVFMQYRNEVPYACQADLKDYIVVEIVVEKNSQKIIFIWKEGQELKILATAARFELKLEVVRD